MKESISLFEHVFHPHVPKNVNEQHKEELSGFNQRLAVLITKATNSMVCAYAFALLALLGFPALSHWLGAIVAIYVVWFSQTFLQLIFLPILSVGQGVLNRHQELQAEEQFNTTVKIYSDMEQTVAHLNKQDEELVKQTQALQVQYQELLKQTTMLTQLLEEYARKSA